MVIAQSIDGVRRKRRETINLVSILKSDHSRVLALVAEGASNTVIALELGIGKNQVVKLLQEVHTTPEVTGSDRNLDTRAFFDGRVVRLLRADGCADGCAGSLG